MTFLPLPTSPALQGCPVLPHGVGPTEPITPGSNGSINSGSLPAPLPPSPVEWSVFPPPVSQIQRQVSGRRWSTAPGHCAPLQFRPSSRIPVPRPRSPSHSPQSILPRLAFLSLRMPLFTEYCDLRVLKPPKGLHCLGPEKRRGALC